MQRNSFSRRGTILVPASPRSSGSLVVFLVLFEARGDGALAQHDVEGLLDVVGVELLVEVDDVVLFVLASAGVRRARRARRVPGPRRRRRRFVDQVVVERRRRLRRGPLRERPRRGLPRRAWARPRTRRHSSRVPSCGGRERVSRHVTVAWRQSFPLTSPLWGRGSITPRSGGSVIQARAPDGARNRPVGRPAKEGWADRSGDRWGRWVARPAHGRRVIATFSTEAPGRPPIPFVTPRPLCSTTGKSGVARLGRRHRDRGRRVVSLNGADDVKRKRNACDQHRRASLQVNDSTKISTFVQLGNARRISAARSASKTLEIVRSVVDESHRLRDRAVPGAFGDLAMHLLRDAPIRRDGLAASYAARRGASPHARSSA